MKASIQIEEMTEHAWNDVIRIYDSGIATGNATFEKHVPDWNSWNKSHRKDCRLIAIVEGEIAGWAALSSVSERLVYAGVAEVSIYIDPDHQRLGIGDTLMKALIEEAENHAVWTLQADIFPENEYSLRLHLNNGFRIVGTREKIGKMDDTWRDVHLLERRSRITGID